MRRLKDWKLQERRVSMPFTPSLGAGIGTGSDIHSSTGHSIVKIHRHRRRRRRRYHLAETAEAPE
jgi:hypothetical protein